MTQPAPSLFELNLQSIITLIYAIPSLFLDVVLVFVLLKSFKSYFYRLFVITAITDIFSWFFGFIASRATNSPMFFGLYAALPANGFIIDWLNFLAYYGGYVTYATSFLVSLNRFTAATMPSRHMRFWKKAFPFLVVAIFVVPIPFTYHILVYGGYLQLRNPDNIYEGYRLDVHEEQSGPRNALNGMIVWSTHGVVMTCMNVWIAISLYRRRRSSTSERHFAVEDTRDTEIMLFIYTLFLFVFTVVNFAGQFLFFVYGNDMTEQQSLLVLNTVLIAADIHTCSAPWLLLLMSRAVRQETTRILCRRRADDHMAFKSRATMTMLH